jgi:GAF domain-containing protein
MTREFLHSHVRTAFDYVAALALAGLALFLSRTLAPQGPPLLPLSLALVAVLASAALGSAGAALLAAAVLAAGIDYFFLLPTGRFKLPGTTAEIAAFGAFAVAALLVAWLSHTARRARRDRARSSEVAARVAVESDRRDALLALTERALAGGSMEAIGREALALMAASLNVKYGAIVELTSDHDLIVTSTIGWDAGTLEGVRMSADADSHLGYALHAREPIVIADAEIDTRFSLPPEVRARGARSGVAARIAGSSGLFGAVVVYETASRRFEKHDTQFLAGITAVLAGVYERKRLDVERIELAARDRAHRLAAELAYKRSAFLAQTATVFDAALEPDATLVSLARLAVPALADCAIVDLVHDDGHVRRVEVVDIDPTRRDESQMLQRQAPSVRSETPFSRAIRTGQPALLSRVRERDPDAHDPEHEQLIRRLQCQSLLLIPLVARGQTLGLLTLAARERRYDAEDLGVAQDLSARAAIALDNSRLYREAQAAAHAKDEFLAMVSHELRTPLNAVLGWATILRQQPLDESRAQHAYAAIERSARAVAVPRAAPGRVARDLGQTGVAPRANVDWSASRRGDRHDASRCARQQCADRGGHRPRPSPGHRRCAATSAGGSQHAGKRGEVFAGRRVGARGAPPRRSIRRNRRCGPGYRHQAGVPAVRVRAIPPRWDDGGQRQTRSRTRHVNRSRHHRPSRRHDYG